MSYVNSIPSAELPNYKQVIDWDAYYKNFKHHFSVQYPGDDFSQVILKMEKMIFPSSVHFKGDYECTIEFADCYFKEEVVFYDTEIKKSLFFRQCFCDIELRIMKTST